MNLELDSPGWVRTDMTMNEITVQTGVANRAAAARLRAVKRMKRIARELTEERYNDGYFRAISDVWGVP